MLAAPYNDDDLVYVDPERRAVVGIVQFSKTGHAKPLAMPDEAASEKDREETGRRRSKPRKRYYPWGTYRTMKKIYRLEGRTADAEQHITLDEAIARCLTEPFWD
jgi:hypothetical protein